MLRPGSPAADGPSSPYASLERDLGLPAGVLWRAIYLDNPAWLDLRVGRGSAEAWQEATRARLRDLAGDRAGTVEERLEELRPRRAHAADRVVEFNPGMIELVDLLRLRYRVSVLSNAAPGLEQELVEHYRIAHLFEDVVNSATVGLAKPDPEIFRLAARRLGLPVPSCFFTDDLLHNVEAARGVGMTAHLFEGVDGLRAALRASGVDC